ncbi:MAG: hypothetical protein ACHQF4_08795 [Sphingobacteriales bacterium]
MDNKIYLSDLRHSTKDLVNYQLIEVRRAISNSSITSKDSIESLARSVSGSVEKGFEIINQQLNEVNAQLDMANDCLSEIFLMLDWKTDIIIEELKIANVYLGNIERLLNKPNELKLSSFYLERGIAMLSNAYRSGPDSDYYRDALKNLMLAYEIDRDDFLCLKHLGLLHFYSQRYFDAKDAGNYFSSSARLAYAYSKTSSSKFNDIFLHSSNRVTLISEAASSYCYSGRCNYILNRIDSSICDIKLAITLQPNNLDFKCDLAKYFAANEQIEDAVKTVQDLLKINPFYAVKLLIDPDLSDKYEIRQLVETLRLELEKKIRQEIKDLQPFKADISKAERAQLELIETQVSDTSFLNLSKIAQILF